MLSALRTLVSPAVFDFWAQHLNKTWAWEQVRARVLAVSPASDDATTLTLRPNRNFRGFQPGQHVNVTLPVNGVRHTRSYSLNHAPRTDGTLSITVRREPHGIVSHALATLKPGDVIELGQAFGDFRLPQDGQRPLLLLAGGSGITPLMSLLEARLAQPASAPVALIYSVREAANACFLAALDQLAEQHPHFAWQLKISSQQGRIQAADIAATGLGRDSSVFICGAHGFADSMQRLCHDFANIQCEAFSAPNYAQAGDAQVTVTLARSGQQVSVSNGGVLLQELEALGLSPAYGCRLGICNTCACSRLEGTTENLRDDLLSHNPGGMVRLCISRAVTDITLDL